MSSSNTFLLYVLEQLSSLDEITYRKMMGEYIIYYRGKIAAYLCDDRLLVKMLPVTETMLPNAKREPPYEGAKDMLPVEQVDDRVFLENLFVAMYPELPEPKKRGKKI